MEPVDPVEDFLTTRGTVRNVSLKVYVPATDAVGDAVPIRGSRGEKRITQGLVPVTTCSWFIAPATPDQTLARPTLKSHLVCGGETWRIDSIDTSPRNGKLYGCLCTLLVA